MVIAACMESQRSHVEPQSGLQISKKQNVPSRLTRKDLIFWGASVTER